ncbi:hypothetical protein D3C86_1959580 [compost metagenome]
MLRVRFAEKSAFADVDSLVLTWLPRMDSPSEPLLEREPLALTLTLSSTRL